MSREKSEKIGDSVPKIVYTPAFHENELEKFKKFVLQRLGLKFDNYWDLYDWSCRDYPEFWECVWHYFGIIHSRPYDEVFDRSRSFENMEWFKGALLNFTENILRYRDSRLAIIATDAYDNDQFITYKDMYEEVCLYEAALKNLGVKKGDTIGCYIANKKEAVFVFLAAASMGVIWGGTAPIYGANATLSRFRQMSPKVIFTSGNFYYAEKCYNLIEEMKIIASGLPSLVKVVFVPSNVPGVVEDITQIPKCCTISEFLEEARRQYKTNPWDLEFEQVSFDHPMTITFTSGTAGQPKGIVHSTGSFLATLRCFLYRGSITKNVYLRFTAVGWISWFANVNFLYTGTTICLYDGHPLEESPTRLWDLVDKFGITSIVASPGDYEKMEMKDRVPTSQHSLKSLGMIFVAGSVLKLRSYDFIQGLKPGIFGFSLYGTTETFGRINGTNSNLPIYRGEHQCFSLGIDVKCLDEDGKEVIGKRGDLVIANPYPALPIGILNDKNKQQLHEYYLDQHPGYWNVSDEIWINPITKGFVVFGRNDETVKAGVITYSCSEIYNALDEIPGIKDTVCVEQSNEAMHVRIILFVKMESETVLTEEVIKDIRNVMESSFSPELVPAVIMQVPDIPYNFIGKKLTLLVKKVVNKLPVSNLDCVVNPECVDFYKNADLGDF